VKLFEGLVALWQVVLWGAGGATTFLLNVIATWTGDASLPMKLLTSVTVDPFLAFGGRSRGPCGASDSGSVTQPRSTLCWAEGKSQSS
jgi:hypothetical protein